MLKNELNLSEYASLNEYAIRLKEINSDIRGEYYRDIDKIIYSLSYTRYSDKTQVFSMISNDNISRRMTHVQMVSKIARTLSRALNLNEDLTEAIALGHDIGHVPFGHTGESILNEISLKYDNTYFMHNVESVRELMCLENNGNGVNLTIQVLDGILSHNGEIVNAIYAPRNKTKEEFLDENPSVKEVIDYLNIQNRYRDFFYLNLNEYSSTEELELKRRYVDILDEKFRLYLSGDED